MNEIKKSLLSITQTAKLLGICTQTLRNWEGREDFPFSVHYTLGGHRRYSTKEVQEYLKNSIGKSKEGGNE